MANLPGGWRRFTARRKRLSFPDVKWAKVELCQLCLTRSKYLKYRVSFVVSAPGWWFSLLPAFSPRALTYHREDLQVGLSHATLFFFSSLCFYSSCSPGLQSFSITLSIFLNTYSPLQNSTEISAYSTQTSLTHSAPGRVRIDLSFEITSSRKLYLNLPVLFRHLA